jgi:hypothetical protein
VDERGDGAVSLADALEAAASALPRHEDAIRPANGDPDRLLAGLDARAAGEILHWLLESRPAAGEELALAWADSDAGVAAIRALDAAHLDKAGRKALRRAQHRLRSRGIELEAPAAAPRVATLPKLDDTLDASLVSPPDPSGAQLVVVVEPSPSGGARVFQGVVDLERGILEFHVVQANRSQARRLVRDLEASERLAATPAPREALAALLARAAEAHPSDRALPPPFVEWRSRIARPSADAATPGDLARAALSAEPLPSLLREVAEGVAAGSFGPWPPDFELLRAWGERISDVAKSALLVDDQQRRAQVDAILEEAVDARFARAGGPRVAYRFEELAYAAWRRGDDEQGRRCIAAARAFREGSPRENPVARALLERALRPLLEALEQQQPASSPERP